MPTRFFMINPLFIPIVCPGHGRARTRFRCIKSSRKCLICQGFWRFFCKRCLLFRQGGGGALPSRRPPCSCGRPRGYLKTPQHWSILPKSTIRCVAFACIPQKQPCRARPADEAAKVRLAQRSCALQLHLLHPKTCRRQLSVLKMA